MSFVAAACVPGRDCTADGTGRSWPFASDAEFTEGDGSEGLFYGTFVALSEEFGTSGD